MRIYVGNLPYSMNDDELRNIFGQFGELAAAEVIMDKFSGQSKGLVVSLIFLDGQPF